MYLFIFFCNIIDTRKSIVETMRLCFMNQDRGESTMGTWVV